MYQESKYVIVANSSEKNNLLHICQGSLRKRYIIDVWQGCEYSSGSEYARVTQGS